MSEAQLPSDQCDHNLAFRLSTEQNVRLMNKGTIIRTDQLSGSVNHVENSTQLKLQMALIQTKT